MVRVPKVKKKLRKVGSPPNILKMIHLVRNLRNLMNLLGARKNQRPNLNLSLKENQRKRNLPRKKSKRKMLVVMTPLKILTLKQVLVKKDICPNLRAKINLLQKGKLAVLL